MLLNFASKSIARSIDRPSYVLVATRFGIGFLFLIPLILKNRQLKTNHLFLHFLRSLIICLVILLTYIGYKSLPISICGAISTTEPIFVAIWSCLLGYETIASSVKLFGIIILSVVGMLLILNPSFDQIISIKAVLILIVNNFICGGNYFLSSKLAQTDSSTTTLIYNMLFVNSFILSTNIILGLTGTGIDFKSLLDIRFPLIMLGLFAAGNSWLALSALKTLDPNIHANIQNLSLPLSMLLGKLQGEIILGRHLIGSIFILLSIVLLQNTRK